MDPSVLITSRSNPQVKLVRSLQERKARAQWGSFLVEGILHVSAAAEAGWQIDSVLYAPDLLSSDYALALLERLKGQGIRCLAVAADVFASMAEKENPQGILAVVRQRVLPLSALVPASFRFGVAAVSPQDPGNVGTLLRTIDAAGADGLILLDGGVDPFHPTAVRASMGTLFWKPLVQASFADFLAWSRVHGYHLVGTSARGSQDYRSVSLPGGPIVLLLGSEQKGLSGEQLAACDSLVRLPMRGRATSLNLSVAAGILLYALTPGAE